jgi:hypothetical protein
MGSDKIMHSLMYIHTCSVLMSSLPLYWAGYLKSHECKLPKDAFCMHSSHNFSAKRNELRYHCCLSQLYFIGH